MDVVALIFWIATAGGGFVLLGKWVANGGARGGRSNFPPAVIFGHFLLAAVGLVIWIVYVASDKDAAGWIAFVLLALVALLGFTMFARWVPTFRATRTSSGAHAPGSSTAGATNVATASATTTTDPGPAERHFPVLIVAGHGLLAATTLVLVLLTMLGVGGS